MSTKKINTITALLIFMVMLFIYLRTAAPGITFWDSSELVTCSAIMGVPHPPGSPLLSLFGRIMTFMPFYDFRGGGFESTAYRINMLAVLSGALTVMLTYLITVKLIIRTTPFRGIFRHDGFIMFGGLIAALLAGFSHLFWENSVEIETYMPALMISMLAVFLTLSWEENSEDPRYVRYLFLAAYLIGLGIGIHLYVLLIVPTVFLIVIAAKPSWFSDIRLWLMFAMITAVIFLVKYFIGPGLFIILAVLLSVLVPLLFVRLQNKSAAPLWRKTLLGMLLCLSLFSIGYSVYPTIMIRASKNPAVNEGNPDNWERFGDYLTRDQYGQGNMLKEIFVRNASAGYQFKYMYLRYFLRQFPDWGPSPKISFANLTAGNYSGNGSSIKYEHVPVFLLILLFYGICFHIKTDIKRFGIFFLYFIISSAGLVLYLNMENPQVRERGYFYLGSFQIIMVWVGFGVYGLISFVRSRFSTRMLTPVTAVLIIMFLTLIPSALISAHIDSGYTNYRLHDRSKDRIAHDLAINMLESCKANAVLFTHGDNDTYPLWYLQHVDGMRQDVSVINLSILSAPWYIKQLRDEGRTVQIALTDSFIDKELCVNSFASFKTLKWTPEPKEVSKGGLTWKMPPAYVTGDREIGFITVSNYMTAHIIDTNNSERPVYFSTYTDPVNMIGLYEYMAMEGLVFRLTREKSTDGKYSVDAGTLKNNIVDKYLYRGITDADVYKSPETAKLVHNYFIAFMDLADAYNELGETENALLALDRAKGLRPWDFAPF
ncbi:DUF2723 domain-containing protein [Candidatus Latescibacterota bacterium]